MEDLEAQLNNFATRCFRNVADRDYISARMCYRAGLISQFHWAALQAFEKYFKAILLYSRIKATNLGHNLAEAQTLAQTAQFKIKLSKTSVELLDHLGNYGNSRYLETSYFIHGPKLAELDQAVWELRRYCRVMNHLLPIPNSDPKPMLELEIERNEKAENQPPQKFRISGGELEKIIENRSHPARAPLIWQNKFYGSSHRKSVTVPIRRYAENSPLFLHPQLLEHVRKFVFIPKK